MHESENHIIIVTELLKGESLNSYIQRRIQNQLSPNEEDTSIIMKQIFSSLNYIHSQNYIHRDLKPENILFRERNNLSSLVIIDFGLSLKFRKGIDILNHSKSGTTLYMSPEHIQGANITHVK